MSFFAQEFRPLARPGWGGNASSHFRGATCMDWDEIRSWHFSQTWGPNWRGHVGQVEYRATGVQKNNLIVGVTRDSTGTPVGNCSLDLYMTCADMIAQQGSSDASGNFTFSNPGSGPFYIVAYKVGTPDIAGTTVNTLIAV